MGYPFPHMTLCVFNSEENANVRTHGSIAQLDVSYIETFAISSIETAQDRNLKHRDRAGLQSQTQRPRSFPKTAPQLFISPPI